MDQMKMIQVDHEYNRRGIGPIQFLLAVMHDTTVPLPVRAKAAKDLCDLGYGEIGSFRHVTIHVTGGMSPHYTPEELNQLRGLQRLYASGHTLTEFDMVTYDGEDVEPIKGRKN
jgi:hypothetical protein